MCFNQLAALRNADDARDGIVQGFGAVAQPLAIVKGAKRATAVADYMRAQHGAAVLAYETAVALGRDAAADRFQAYAAATELTANLLDALVASDDVTARGLIEEFVNDAVDTGVVLV